MAHAVFLTEGLAQKARFPSPTRSHNNTTQDKRQFDCEAGGGAFLISLA